MARQTSKSYLYKRYLASVFVNAKHITPEATLITTLLTKLTEFQVLPNVVYEEVKGVRNPRVAFTSLNNQFQIVLGSSRFDVSLQSPEQHNIDLGSFSEFCDRAIKIFTVIFGHFKILKGNRLAAVTDRLLNDDIISCPPKEIIGKLFQVPPIFQNKESNEFDWKIVTRVNQTFGKNSETCNFITAITRHPVILIEVNQNTARQTASEDETNFLIDLNTVQDRQSERFEIEDINDYFKSAVVWQKQINKEVLSLLGDNDNGERNGSN